MAATSFEALLGQNGNSQCRYSPASFLHKNVLISGFSTTFPSEYPLADVHSVHALLDELRKPGKSKNKDEPLKQLFWHELEYERVNRPLSRQGWAESARSVLDGDPILFATGGEQFQVIYSRLRSDKLLKAEERPIVSRLLQDHPYALFVFSNQQQDRWHFLNVKYDDEVQRRRLFRRISVTPEDRLRTASERISKIGLAEVSDLEPIAIQARHDDAFDVEPVTKEFFQEYRRVFENIENAIQGIPDAERKRLFTQRLFNRIMFIAFVQKKGWLKFQGDTDYLQALWHDHQRDTIRGRNFYVDRLKALFFYGLNGGAAETDVANINRGGQLRNVYGEVPYLNGGLFEEDDDDRNRKIVVPDSAIAQIIDEPKGLFSRFNFTVNESTPLDIEVAVDPEMLGKIFEELVTGRHETGSYYTPKPIVSFMCREALKGYLESAVPNQNPKAIEAFVDDHHPEDLRNAEAVLEALRKVKVCDPACGSGAYLLGMLHELFDLRECLFATRKLDSVGAHQRKLEIIQNNLYGVDLDAFAVNIARLRLWLSLVVEYSGQKPPPLPNLDYKIEIGDTVCSPSPQGIQLGLRASAVDRFLQFKSQYMTAHGSDKFTLRDEIDRCRREVASWAHRASGEFDWCIDFVEVFFDGGFDVVLANPPYVRMELFKEIKPRLKENFPLVHAERADLYCYFYARAIEILKPSGMLSFISSNKWLRAKYGAPLRRYLYRSSELLHLIDFGDLPVFESASSYPMILVGRKSNLEQKSPLKFTVVSTLKLPTRTSACSPRSAGMLSPEEQFQVTNGFWPIKSNMTSSTE